MTKWWETMVDVAKSLVVGNSLDDATQLGPLVTAGQRDRVEAYIAKGSQEGARLVTGGGRPASQRTGWFVEPTVFADVEAKQTIAQEEIFGPVVTITPYADDDDAARIANDSEYGLAGTVWTSDPERGVALAKRIVTGTVGINGYIPDLHSPVGGMKASGIGCEWGPEGLRNYQRFQSVYL